MTTTDAIQQLVDNEQVDPSFAAFARTVLRVYGIHSGTAPHPPAIEGAQLDLTAEFTQEIGEQDAIDADWLIWWLGRTSRDSKPRLLWEAFTSGKLSTDTLLAVLPATWRVSDTLQLPPSQWLALFRATGYTEDGRPWYRPPQPVELWRGATGDHRTGPYWTVDRAYAEHIMTRRAGRTRLWHTVAEPWRLLAHFSAPTGDEYVVDTYGLPITPVG
ncbi:hypothetical protein SRB17_05480 [Streptomyces sp. RB17]|uniref:hypothetical protein n=1 Tax=Streptomyces sp. RB17 TaxID=2585197 RepID=UPI00129652CA|nr:hypothetical protein [Streptomyces sp. RB17]MQY32594.1 hypothetical protein [Streptomyces sp. RB17]